MEGLSARITNDGVPVNRLWQSIGCAVRMPNGCWEWCGTTKDNGYGIRYGVFKWRNWGKTKQGYAHRLAYIIFYGDIPKGKEINHLCKNTLCVNPQHLQAATRRENLLHGDTFASKNCSKDRCIHGHLFDESNTHFTTDGSRKCRACDRIKRQKYVAAHSEQVREAKRRAYWTPGKSRKRSSPYGVRT